MAGERELGVALNPPTRPSAIPAPPSPRQDRFAGMSDLERIAFALKSFGAGLQKAGGRQNVPDPGAELLEGKMRERVFGLQEEQVDISRQRLKSEMSRAAAQQNLNTIKAQLQAIKDFEPGMAAKVVNMLQIANAGQGIDNPHSLVDFVQQNQKDMEDRLSQIDPNNLDRQDIFFISKLAGKMGNADAAKAFLASFGIGGGALPKLGQDVTAQLAVLAGRIGLTVDQIDPRNPVHARLIDQAIEKVGTAKTELAVKRGTGLAQAQEDVRLGRKIRPEVLNLLELPPEVRTVRDAETEGINIPKPGSIQMRKLQETKAFSQQFLRAANIVQDLIRKSPESVGVSGAAASAVNSLVAQTTGVLKLFEIDVRGSLDPKDYEDTWSDIGITNARLKAVTLGLAYSAAAASNVGTGVGMSDRDIELQIIRIGASQQDPVARIAVLEDIKEEIDFRFRSEVANVLGPKPPSLIKRKKIDQENLKPEDILRLLPDELFSLDAATLTPEQRKAVDEALKKLNL